ncbi:MAG: ABC transporter substrate-binding protein, partial [Burkholderiales bacterium]|nr:ABC transporter substrate-binding protein [Burkholderiales bacterium]
MDDRGKTLDAGVAARRVVALSPHLAELLHEIGAGTDLVGVVRGADFPEAVKQVVQVGDASGIDLERVLALRPDLVLAWESGNRASDLARLEAMGLRLFVSEPRDLSAVPSTLRRLGRLSGREQAGEQAAAAFEARLRVLRARATASVPTFVQIWDSPLMTISGEHLISQALHHCGGDNVFAALPALAASVALES